MISPRRDQCVVVDRPDGFSQRTCCLSKPIGKRYYFRTPHLPPRIRVRKIGARFSQSEDANTYDSRIPHRDLHYRNIAKVSPRKTPYRREISAPLANRGKCDYRALRISAAWQRALRLLGNPKIAHRFTRGLLLIPPPRSFKSHFSFGNEGFAENTGRTKNLGPPCARMRCC